MAVRRNPNLKAEFMRPENHRRWSVVTANMGRTAIQYYAPVETGATRDTIAVETFVGPKGPTVRFRAQTSYAIFPEVGTGLYGPLHRWITPQTAQALSWISNRTGRRVYAKRVRGQRPQRYFKRGLERLFGADHVIYYGAQGGPPV